MRGKYAKEYIEEKKPNVYYHVAVAPNQTVGPYEQEDPLKLLSLRLSPDLGSLDLCTMGTSKDQPSATG